MKKLSLAVMMIAVLSVPATVQADLLITGQELVLGGPAAPGTYSLGIFAESTDGPEGVSNYQFDLDFSNPNVDFIGFNFATASGFLDTAVEGTSTSPTNVGIAQFTFGPFLNVGSAPVLLGVLDFAITSPVVGVLEIPFDADANGTAYNGSLPVSFGQGPTVSAVPSPTGLGALASLGFIGACSVVRRRRDK